MKNYNISVGVSLDSPFTAEGIRLRVQNAIEMALGKGTEVVCDLCVEVTEILEANENTTLNTALKLSNEKAEEVFYHALCNGLSELGRSGIEIIYNLGEYETAKDAMKKEDLAIEGYESVYVQMLRMGYRLTTLDHEDNESDQSGISIGIQDVYDNMAYVPLRHMTDAISENDDATTADVILQSIFFKEVIFG